MRTRLVVAGVAALMVLGGTVAFGAAAPASVSCSIDANVLTCPLPPPVTSTVTQTVTSTVTAASTTAAATTTAATTPTTTATTAPPPSGVTLNLDWDTCDNSQWTAPSALEAGSDPAHNSVIEHSITRPGTGCSNKFEVRNSPTDINFGFRSLWAKYNTDEGTDGGTDFVYGMSIRLSAIPDYAMVWELHQRANIYSVNPNLALAPHAILVRNGQLQYREMTGAGNWNGSTWTGMANYQDQKTLIPTVATNTWYDVLVHVKTSEGADGLTQVYAKQAGQPWPSTPTWQNSGPSLPFIPGGKDPKVPNKIDTFQKDGVMSGLYLESGIYTGSTTWSQTAQQIDVYLDQLRRYSDVPSAKSGWPSN